MYKVIFLGDRLIAANALKLLASEQFSSEFEITVLVSSEGFIKKSNKHLGVYPILTISNEARNTELIEEAIVNHGVNLLISVQHNWILSKQILSKVNLAFNLHNAKLPDYKGYNSISHAIHNRDENFYSTLHWMAEKVDMGDIAYEATTQIDKDEDAYSLYLKTVIKSNLIFEKLLQDLKNGITPPKRPITEKGVFYDRNRLSSLKDLSQVTDDEEFDFRVRSVFFPPHEPAYLIKNNNKIHLIPEKWKDSCWQKIEAGYTPSWTKI